MYGILFETLDSQGNIVCSMMEHNVYHTAGEAAETAANLLRGRREKGWKMPLRSTVVKLEDTLIAAYLEAID